MNIKHDIKITDIIEVKQINVEYGTKYQVPCIETVNNLTNLNSDEYINNKFTSDVKIKTVELYNNQTS